MQIYVLKCNRKFLDDKIFGRKIFVVLFCFCFTTLCDWLAKFAPLFQPMRSKTTTTVRVSRSHAFSRACRLLHEFASSSDWFVAQFTSVVTGQSNYFGFSFENRSKTERKSQQANPMYTQKSSPKGSPVNAITSD